MGQLFREFNIVVATRLNSMSICYPKNDGTGVAKYGLAREKYDKGNNA
jgi:hypothetical protein